VAGLKPGHPESFHRKARRRRQLVVDFDDFFRPGYQESPFRDCQTFYRNAAYNEKLRPQRAAFGVNVFARKTCQVLKPLGRHKITDLFVYLPNNAFQKRLVPFAVATEQPYFARSTMPTTSSRRCNSSRPLVSMKIAPVISRCCGPLITLLIL
jgi:hypothetical protein